MEMKNLKKSLEASPIVDKNGYNYFVHPITDGIPKLDPEVLDELSDKMHQMAEGRFDYIIGAEAMAIPLCVALSLKMRKPYVIVRKRQYGLDGEKSVNQITGYSKNTLYVNYVHKGDRVLLVDDVVSTGGTLKAVVHTLKALGVEIVDIIIAIEKGPGKADLEKDLNMPIKSVIRVDIKDGKVVVLD